MARLEPANWTSLDVGMALNGAIPMPEDASPLSPTDSLDSAIGHSPRPPGNSGKYLTYGGPGFSVGRLDAVKGSADRIPVPFPRLPSCAETADYVAFTQSPVQCAAAVGENQVWVGTEAGSLHVFELNRDYQFSSHAFTTLDSSVLCILPRYTSLTDSLSEASVSLSRSSRMDVLIGSSSGVVTIVTGETNPRGGLRDPSTSLRRARKVLHLESETEEEGKGVNCIAAVSLAGRETFWCGYGKKIVVLGRGNWEENHRLDGTLVSSNEQLVIPDKAEVVKLLSSEQGVWSSLSFSSAVSLWDTDTLKPKLHINCCAFSTAEVPMADIPQLRALHFSYPYLLVGTSKGDLIVFHIQNATPPTQSPSHMATPTQTKCDYRVVTAEHCGMCPILDIFATPLRIEEERRSPFCSSLATPTSLQVLVVCGQSEAEQHSMSQSQILLYELVTSPSASPLNSPRPLSSLDQRSASVTSYQSVSSSSSLSLRRRSLGVIPKLTFHSVSRNSFTLLPLRST